MSQTRGPAPVKSFFRVVTTDAAREHIRGLTSVGKEVVAVRGAAGRVLGRAIKAPADLPHFNRSDMDGYAVRAADTFGASPAQPAYLKIAGTIEMGQTAKRPLLSGQAMRIATGGMVPPGADAVVMVEYTDELDDGSVEVRRSVSPWQHVLRKGEDITRGTPVLPVGRRLRPRDVGALTGLGVTRVSVFRRPRVGLVSTGDEIVPPERKPRPGQVRNINQFSLVAMAEEAGGVVTDYGVVRDRAEDLRSALAQALLRNDVVFISGGSSVGAKDLTTEIITSFAESEIVCHGISVAPGKPTILARAQGKPVIGLPGHPVSAIVIFELFGVPLVRVVGGESPERVFEPRRAVRARLGQNVASQPGREDYVRVHLVPQEGGLVAQPLAGKSGAVMHLVQADGLVGVPALSEGLEEGTEVEVILI
jgi:molybdopterin molybdotransferase